MLDKMFNEFKDGINNEMNFRKMIAERVEQSTLNEVSIKKNGNDLTTIIDGDLMGVTIALSTLIADVSKQSDVPIQVVLAGINMFSEILVTKKD